MKYTGSNKKMVQLLVNYCCQFGVKHVVLSPGSRNAPLIISFDNHPTFTCYTIPDERSAGFYALGLARQLNEPVALVCTSGTAVLNYAPAVAEAYYQKIPLIVITADRPPELIDQEDGQTIRQPDAFYNSIGKSVNMPIIDSASHIKDISIELDKAFRKVTAPQKYPIHINIHLDEPLYETETVETDSINSVEKTERLPDLKPEQLADLTQAWNQCNKIMVLSGIMLPDKKLNSLLNDLARKKNVVIVAPATANLSGEGIFSPAEGLFLSVNEDEKDLFKPDLLITVGGPVVSKTIKQFIRNHNPKFHFDIDIHPEIINTYGCLTKKIDENPITFVTFLNNNCITKSTDYINLWKERQLIVNKRQHEFIDQIPWSDLWIYNALFKHITTPVNLHLGNSTPVRYTEYFGKNELINYFCNRGTSGIDGCTSTAAGAALAGSEPTLLISGDISFIYDSNALWNSHVPKNLKILVINNNGGNIFNVVAGKLPKEQLDRYFITQQQGSIKHLCKAFNINYLSATDQSSLTAVLPNFFSSSTCTVLEVFTPDQISTDQWRSLVSILKK